jgi:hypothetical protein
MATHVKNIIKINLIYTKYIKKLQLNHINLFKKLNTCTIIKNNRYLKETK